MRGVVVRRDSADDDEEEEEEDAPADAVADAADAVDGSDGDDDAAVGATVDDEGDVELPAAPAEEVGEEFCLLLLLEGEACACATEAISFSFCRKVSCSSCFFLGWGRGSLFLLLLLSFARMLSLFSRRSSQVEKKGAYVVVVMPFASFSSLSLSLSLTGISALC